MQEYVSSLQLLVIVRLTGFFSLFNFPGLEGKLSMNKESIIWMWLTGVKIEHTLTAVIETIISMP